MLQNNEGGEKVRNEFQSQVKKLLGEKSIIPSEAIVVDESQLSEEIINKSEEINDNTNIVEEVPVAIINSDLIVGININTQEIVDINESCKETPTNVLTSSTLNQEIQSQSTDSNNIVQNVVITDESHSVKKIPDEESSKPGNTYLNRSIIV